MESNKTNIKFKTNASHLCSSDCRHLKKLYVGCEIPICDKYDETLVMQIHVDDVKQKRPRTWNLSGYVRCVKCIKYNGLKKVIKTKLTTTKNKPITVKLQDTKDKISVVSQWEIEPEKEDGYSIIAQKSVEIIKIAQQIQEIINEARRLEELAKKLGQHKPKPRTDEQRGEIKMSEISPIEKEK